MGSITTGSFGGKTEFPPKSKVNIFCITTHNTPAEIKESLAKKVDDIALMLSANGYDSRPDRSYHYFEDIINRAPLKKKIFWVLQNVVQSEADHYSGEIKSILSMERFFEYAGSILKDAPVIYVSDIRTKMESERKTATYSHGIPKSLWVSPVSAYHEMGKDKLENALYSFMSEIDRN